MKKEHFSQGENQESWFGHFKCEMPICYLSREVGIQISKFIAQWKAQSWQYKFVCRWYQRRLSRRKELKSSPRPEPWSTPTFKGEEEELGPMGGASSKEQEAGRASRQGSQEKVVYEEDAAVN